MCFCPEATTLGKMPTAETGKAKITSHCDKATILNRYPTGVYAKQLKINIKIRYYVISPFRSSIHGKI
jgi:hypothetical protein